MDLLADISKIIMKIGFVLIILFSGYQIYLDNTRPEAIVTDTGVVLNVGCTKKMYKSQYHYECRTDIKFKNAGQERLSLSFSVLEGDTVEKMLREEYKGREEYKYLRLKEK